jgi:hypothetical protein
MSENKEPSANAGDGSLTSPNPNTSQIASAENKNAKKEKFDAATLNEKARRVSDARDAVLAFVTRIEAFLVEVEARSEKAVQQVQEDQQALQSALAAIASAKPAQPQNADNSNLNRPPGWTPQNPAIHPD